MTLSFIINVLVQTPGLQLESKLNTPARTGVANLVPAGTTSPAVTISVARKPVLKIDLITNYHCLKFD